MTDSELLKTTRKSLGLKQKEMAKLLGYAFQGEISALENGKPMSNQTKAHLLTLNKKECNNSECDRCGGEVGASSTICFNCGKREYY